GVDTPLFEDAGLICPSLLLLRLTLPWRTGGISEESPIRARSVGWVERGVKWARRRPAVAALVGVSLTAIVGLLVLGVALWSNAESRAAAVKQLNVAEQELEDKRLAGEAMNRDLEDLRRRRTDAEKLLGAAVRARDAAQTEEDKARGELTRLRK